LREGGCCALSDTEKPRLSEQEGGNHNRDPPWPHAGRFFTRLTWSYVVYSRKTSVKFKITAHSESGLRRQLIWYVLPLLFLALNALPQNQAQPPPKITALLSPINGVITLRLQGPAGQTNIIEASADMVTWVPINTNVMPATKCSFCPFVDFDDASITNSARRFYRSRVVR
jgi:hypothetical protein